MRFTSAVLDILLETYLLGKAVIQLSIMGNIVAIAIKKYFQLRTFQFLWWKKNQISTQKTLLFSLLKKAQQTDFGKEHDFASIKNYRDFTQKIPLRKYEQTEPYIALMLKGEENILWPGQVKNFSKSSGTTNSKSKYLPVSSAALHKNNYKAGRDIYTIFFKNYPNSKLFLNNGSVFSLGGSYTRTEGGAKVGDISAIIMSELPAWAQKLREPSLNTALLTNWKEKIPAMISETVGKNITHLSGVPTWFIGIFEELKKQYPYKTLRDIWPQLELFVHGAVAFEPYKKIFRELLPFNDMKYMEVYNASEGFFAIQDDPERKGEMLLLTDHGIFYEFIPMKDYGSPDAVTLPLWEVQQGINYAMIVTTNAGLWRYDLGDTVCFTSTKPYRITITGRTKHFINVFGEELMVGNTDAAIATISEEMDVIVEHYTAAPIFMNEQGKGGHEWVIEFIRPPRNVKQFQHRLDVILQSLNSDYAAKRQHDLALQELTLQVVPEGTFLTWMEERGKLGGQHKVPRLSNERKYVEELLALGK